MKPNVWDRVVTWFSPDAGLRRLQARAAVGVFEKRNYKAASSGHRTNGWARSQVDVNAVTRFAGAELRLHARDLIRNNAWARRGQRTISNNVVGWGIVPRPNSADKVANTKAAELWKAWADSTDCESEGRHTLYSLQGAVIRAVASDGEVLVRRRWRKPTDAGASGTVLPLPMQLQLLEIDHLDTSKDQMKGAAGGPIVQGVEYDLLGRRAAYWIFPEHPGASTTTGLISRRTPASEILHVFDQERPGQARGVSWFGSAIVDLKDFDEFEDAELMRQKIAACFAVFIEGDDGQAAPLGTADAVDETVDTLEPGMIKTLKPGSKVFSANPPGTTTDGFTARTLRRVAAGIGIPYEELTGDYSQVNFSSARLARISHQGNVKHWQWDVLIPLFCAGVFRWAMEAAVQSGQLGEVISADWTVPPLPMIEPDKEGLAYSRLIRNGIMTFSEAIREQGGDPEAHWAEYAADKKRLDELGLMLDSDAEKTSQAGLTQARAGVDSGGAPPPADPPPDPPVKPDPKVKRAALLAELAALDA